MLLTDPSDCEGTVVPLGNWNILTGIVRRTGVGLLWEESSSLRMRRKRDHTINTICENTPDTVSSSLSDL